MKENNGKIVIAILAMFVVALSVVGFTYAYFTAQIVGNNSDDNSAEVTAGVLSVDYTSTRSIDADNIVPGWISDGDMYYDPVHSIQEVKEINAEGAETGKMIKGIVAVSEAALADQSKSPTVNPEEYGQTEAIEFNVTNTGTDTALYSIVLTDITNQIADKSNFKVTLYETSVVGQDGKPVFSNADIVSEDDLALEETGKTQTIYAQGSVGTEYTEGAEGAEGTYSGETKYYKLVLNYEDSGNQNDSAGAKAVKATVKVVGLGQAGQAE